MKTKDGDKEDNNLIKQLEQILQVELQHCMITDKYHLQAQVRRLLQQQSNPKNIPTTIKQLEAAIAASQRIYYGRAKTQPRVDYPQALPICQQLETIKALLTKHQVLIIAGETGSGKTTQLPKLCLELGLGTAGLIGHTQPRRVAARSVAHRIASELHVSLGEAVGYQTRFSNVTGDNTYIKLMTDGILLAEIQQDRYLNKYQTLIIDEAHERSLNIDFILGYLKRLLPKRPDLKVIITSATINPQQFADFFADAPVLEIPGRGYPVEIIYRDISAEKSLSKLCLEVCILDTVQEMLNWGQGDILIFLAGERDIREVSLKLRRANLRGIDILPLYARLPIKEQNKVFAQAKHRRIILTTNVAETSLTVPGIHYVIDVGTARISRYSHRSKVQRLPIERISQASAKQRAGRCGRIGPGVCVRLYSEEDFLARAEFTTPEIHRTHLAAVILQMAVMGLGDIRHFEFLQAPEGSAISAGYKTLYEIGAVDEQQRLTKLGRQIAKFPIDPRLARMLIAAKHFACVNEVLIIISLLSIQDPRERPLEKQQAADEAHSVYKDTQSDFISMINLWHHYEEQRQALSKNKLKTYCNEHYLSYPRMLEWRDIHRQLLQVCQTLKFTINQTPADYASLHQALLPGLLSFIAVKENKSEYQGAHGTLLHLFPGSALFKKRPTWIMAAEIAETSKVYGRTIASIEPAWLEPAAKHLLKHHYFEPYWQRKQQQVAGYERVSLYGLTIIAKRKINYGPHDPKTAREIFIREALVQQQLSTDADFYQHNIQLIEQVQQMEAKIRRHDLLVSEQTLYDFYAERIPAVIYNGPLFHTWLQQQKADYLCMTTADLLLREPHEITPQSLPDVLQIAGQDYPLSYVFDPESAVDGVCVTIPILQLPQIPLTYAQWVPEAWLEDKMIELLRLLPKSVRRQLVPLPDFVRTCHAELDRNNPDLQAQLQTYVRAHKRLALQENDWQVEAISPHLRLIFCIVDEQGESIAQSRDLAALQQQLRSEIKQSAVALPITQQEQAGITGWDFADLAESTVVEDSGKQAVLFPALVDEGESVALRYFVHQQEADYYLHKGLVRLFVLANQQTLKYLSKRFPYKQELERYLLNVYPWPEFFADIVACAAEHVFLAAGVLRTQVEFEARLAEHKESLLARVSQIAKVLLESLRLWSNLREQLESLQSPARMTNLADIQQQMRGLIFPGFIAHTSATWLFRYPAYFRGIQQRVEKIQNHLGKDIERLDKLQPVLQACEFAQKHVAQLPIYDPKQEVFATLRWHLQEYRLSLFAQSIKTSVKVSQAKLLEQIKALS